MLAAVACALTQARWCESRWRQPGGGVAPSQRWLRRVGAARAKMTGALPAQFEPWGGYVACSVSSDCFVESVAARRLPTCVRFSGGLPEGVPLGRYCVCNIVFQRFGAGCRESATPASWLAVAVLMQLCTLALFVPMATLLVRAWWHKALRRSIGTCAAVLATATELAVVVYCFAGVFQAAGGTSALVDGAIFVVSKTLVSVLYFTSIALWRVLAFEVAEQSFEAGRTMRNRSRELRVVAMLIAVLVVAVPALELMGQYMLMQALIMMYVAFGTYQFLRTVRQLRAIFKDSVLGDEKDGDLARFFARLVACRRDGILGVLFIMASLAFYVLFSEEHDAASLSPSFASFTNLHATKVIVALGAWGHNRLALGHIRDALGRRHARVSVQPTASLDTPPGRNPCRAAAAQ
jgi:hypothetical protein